MYWKRSTPIRNVNRRDKLVLRTTCIKYIKFKIIKTRAGYEWVEYFYYSENLDWAACGLRALSWIYLVYSLT